MYQVTEPDAPVVRAIIFNASSVFSDNQMTLNGRDYTSVMQRMYKSQEYNAVVLSRIIETPRLSQSRVLVIVSSILHGTRLADALSRLTGKTVSCVTGASKRCDRQRIFESGADIIIATAPLVENILCAAHDCSITDVHIVGAPLHLTLLSRMMEFFSHRKLSATFYEYHVDIPVLHGTHARSIKLYQSAGVSTATVLIKDSSWLSYVNVFVDSAKRVTLAAGVGSKLVAACTDLTSIAPASEYPDAFAVLDANKVRSAAVLHLEADLRAVVENFERVESLSGHRWVTTVALDSLGDKSFGMRVDVRSAV